MIVVLIILGIFIYAIIGRVVYNSVDFNDRYNDKEDYMFFLMIIWPLVVCFQLAKFIGDWINGN